MSLAGASGQCLLPRWRVGLVMNGMNSVLHACATPKSLPLRPLRAARPAAIPTRREAGLETACRSAGPTARWSCWAGPRAGNRREARPSGAGQTRLPPRDRRHALGSADAASARARHGPARPALRPGRLRQRENRPRSPGRSARRRSPPQPGNHARGATRIGCPPG